MIKVKPEAASSNKFSMLITETIGEPELWPPSETADETVRSLRLIAEEDSVRLRLKQSKADCGGGELHNVK